MRMTMASPVNPISRTDVAFSVAGLLLAAALAGGAQAADIPAVGRYSSLRHVPDTDDYLGLNLEILPGPSPTVRYELCEGWCNGAQDFPAQIEGGTIRFTVRQELRDQTGAAVSPRVYRVEARVVRTLRGRRLVVTSPDDRELHEVLKPVERAP
jgi:hypothetical protein